MTESQMRASLAARYDGPPPAWAAVASDWDRSRKIQIEARKLWAWREVRRLGHRMASARRAFRATGSPLDRADWAAARGSLGHALSTWAFFRDWLRRYSETQR